MNLSPDWERFLKSEGFDVRHWGAVGDARASDAEVMDWAREHGYIVFTHDLDFGALLANTRSLGPSVIQARTQDVTPMAIGSEVVRVLRMRRDDIERGAIVTIDKVRSRVRVLPVRTEEDDRSVE